MINFSTGRIISKLHLDDEITAMDNDHTGQIIFAGDAQVLIWQSLLFLTFGKISQFYLLKFEVFLMNMFPHVNSLLRLW